MRLYLNDTSPFARFTLVTALEAEIQELELCWVDPWSSPETLIQRNPFSTVPTLETDNGIVLFESLFICNYLLAHANPNKPAPIFPSPAEPELLRRFAFGKMLMETAFKKVIFERFFNNTSENTLSARASIALGRALDSLDNHLATSEQNQNLPDLCLAVALEYIHFRLKPLFDRHISPHGIQWLDSYRSRSSFLLSTPEKLKHHPSSLILLKST